MGRALREPGPPAAGVAPLRLAVVGHVEWVTFARVGRPPAAGEIADASETWEDVGGGAAVPAVDWARLGAESHLFTALGEDEAGRRSRARLEELGVRVHAAGRAQPQPRALTHIDAGGERTITVLAPWLSPGAGDDLPREGFDGIYFVSGDAAALRAARRAPVLVAAGRARRLLAEADVPLDVLVSSGRDPAEAVADGALDPPPGVVLETLGAQGGRWRAGRERGEWRSAPAPGAVQDAYGCGDCFAAGLLVALARGRPLEEALAFAAERGAAALTRRGT